MWKYRIGDVVLKKKSSFDWPVETRQMWGHIIGFSSNALGETTLTVQWDNQTVRDVHPVNVMIEDENI
jgi:predicted membrane chloride channel (bestrophin family)